MNLILIFRPVFEVFIHDSTKVILAIFCLDHFTGMDPSDTSITSKAKTISIMALRLQENSLLILLRQFCDIIYFYSIITWFTTLHTDLVLLKQFLPSIHVWMKWMSGYLDLIQASSVWFVGFWYGIFHSFILQFTNF